MAWYADLEHLNYFDRFVDVDTTMLRAVGWLAHEHEFKQSGVALAAVDKLRTLLVSPWQPTGFAVDTDATYAPGQGKFGLR